MIRARSAQVARKTASPAPATEGQEAVAAGHCRCAAGYILWIELGHELEHGHELEDAKLSENLLG